MQWSALAVVLLAAAACAVEPPVPFNDYCIVNDGNAYDPSKAVEVPWFNISLDDDPYHRWDAVASTYKQDIQNMIYILTNMSDPLFHGSFVAWVDRYFPTWADYMPEPYQSEIKGIANVTGINLGEIVLYNIFYELFSVCTSIVAETPQGKLYHVRNMDFGWGLIGLFIGWNHTSHTWKVTDALRPVLFNVNWIKDGQVLYKSVNFAGYVGVYNAVKQGQFTITMNERFNIAGGWLGLLQWIMGLTPDAKFSTFLVRETMQNATSFDTAADLLRNNRVIAPAYYILGGTKAGEGVTIVRGLNSVVEQQFINSTAGSWYVLQTNYDPSKQPMYLDDRRTPGNNCMHELGRNNVSFKGLFNVLSSKTNLNALTAYTTLMDVDSGAVETYRQYCPQPCWFA